MTEMKQDNARNPEQLQRMRKLKADGLCLFCDNNYLKVGGEEAIFTTNEWYIRKNDFPYKDTKFHYLIISKVHVKKLSELHASAWQDLLQALSWIESNCPNPGLSLFVRLGDMTYTGATIDHLHIHAIGGGTKVAGSHLEDNLLVTLGHKV